ncbi:endo-1,4-beta-xylanase, partial [Candidatus Aminicenantes bacterium AC-708-M15]|nr:endo-1,4-beta-xylanase [Candidatus Aminicenantes bacterium AC-708-M15]
KRGIVLISIFLILSQIIFSQQNPSPYGINGHVPKNRTLSLIKNAGIKWVRVDFNWYEIESSKGNFNWKEMDRVVNNSIDKGLSILGVLAYTPSWANNGKSKNYPPLKKQYWTNFVKKVVRRYKSKVKYWSMWNEPNLEKFWSGTLDEYVFNILIPGAQTAKSIDSNCKIVGPDLSHLTTGDNMWNIWLRAILREAKDYIDVISHHIYDIRGPTYIFDKLENDQGPLLPSVLRVLKEEGVDNKPFWITETGWPTDEVGEEVQSKYYLEFLQGMRNRSYINKIFFYEIIDDPRPEIPKYGIIYNNFTPKKAYYTYKDFIAGKYPPEEPENKGESDTNCPIITTLNKDKNSSRKIIYLKSLRDNLLKSTIRGNEIIKLYYRYSPEVNSILLNSPYARELALECLKPFVKFSEELFKNPLELENKKFYLKQRDWEKIEEFIEILRAFASPELFRIVNEIEERLPQYKEKSLNELILKLEFEFSFLRKEKENKNEK